MKKISIFLITVLLALPVWAADAEYNFREGIRTNAAVKSATVEENAHVKGNLAVDGYIIPSNPIKFTQFLDEESGIGVIQITNSPTLKNPDPIWIKVFVDTSTNTYVIPAFNLDIDN